MWVEPCTRHSLASGECTRILPVLITHQCDPTLQRLLNCHLCSLMSNQTAYSICSLNATSVGCSLEMFRVTVHVWKQLNCYTEVARSPQEVKHDWRSPVSAHLSDFCHISGTLTLRPLQLRLQVLFFSSQLKSTTDEQRYKWQLL